MQQEMQVPETILMSETTGAGINHMQIAWRFLLINDCIYLFMPGYDLMELRI